MKPSLEIDRAIIKRNAQAWAAHTGVPVRAVVKCQGYGWGYRPLVEALDGIVAGYCVADAQELRAVRRLTALPIVVLGAVDPAELQNVLEDGGIPTVGSLLELELASQWARRSGRPLRLRVGVLPAAGWSGLELREIGELAGAVAASGAEIELWTHITDPASREEQVQRFVQSEGLLRRAGARIVATDVASTYPAASGEPIGNSVRIGVGLFGAGASAVPGVECALRVTAPVTRIERRPAGSRVGYGVTVLLEDDEILTLRCGYGDGFPKSLSGVDDILSIGMQYITTRSARYDADRTQVVLLDRTSSLDEFAAKAGRLTHEIVTAFGNAARANGVSTEV
ncbi:MAG: alanine racemase [Vulcanimicrobiaceae bacterium]